MQKLPYFIKNPDGTFVFHGYYTSPGEARDAVPYYEAKNVVDASFLYRTIQSAKDALNSQPNPNGA